MAELALPPFQDRGREPAENPVVAEPAVPLAEAAVLDEVRARADQLDREALQGLLTGLLGDLVRAGIAKEATFILKSSSIVLVTPSCGAQHSRPRPYGSVRCFACKRFDHMTRDCFLAAHLSCSPWWT